MSLTDKTYVLLNHKEDRPVKNRKMVKMLISVALLVALLGSSVVGCASEPERADPFGPVAEKITLRVGKSEDASCKYLSGESATDNYFIQYLEDALQIEYSFDFVVPTDAYATKVSMAIASGEMPDVMTVNPYQLQELVEAGAVADLSEAYETYASEDVKGYYASNENKALKNVTFGGKLMALPSQSPDADAIPMLFVRKDWLDELGLKEPETLEDIIVIVNAFKENKGADAGLVVSNHIVTDGTNNSYGLDALFASFGSYPKHFTYDGEGNLVYGSNTAETKAALAEIKKLVDTGVIDKSFIVRDTEQCQELVTSGKSGVFFGVWWNMDWPLNSMVEQDNNVRWECYTAPLGENGKYNIAMAPVSSQYIVVKAGASEAVKEAVVKSINWQCGIEIEQGASIKPEASSPYSGNMAPFTLLLCAYTEKEDKAKQVMDVVNGSMAESDLIGESIVWYQSYVNAEENIADAFANENANGWSYVRGAYPLNNEKINKVFSPTYAKTSTMASRWATLEKLEDETFLKILNGNIDIDAFDDYVEEWNKLGGSAILEELKATIE